MNPTGRYGGGYFGGGHVLHGLHDAHVVEYRRYCTLHREAIQRAAMMAAAVNLSTSGRFGVLDTPKKPRWKFSNYLAFSINQLTRLLP